MSFIEMANLRKIIVENMNRPECKNVVQAGLHNKEDTT